MKSHKKIEEAFKKEVWKQGFSFENRVFSLFDTKRWSIAPNPYFQYSENSDPKEYDLRVHKTIEIKGYRFFFVLAIECVYNPAKIVFYSRKKKTKQYFPLITHFGEDFEKRFSFSEVVKVFKKMSWYENTFFSEDQVIGFQVFNKKSNIDNKKKVQEISYVQDHNAHRRIQDAIQGVAAAARYEKDIRVRNPKKSLTNAFIVFPLVVFSDGLFEASERQNRSIKRVHHVLYNIGLRPTAETTEVQELFVQLLDYEALKGITYKFNQVFNHLSDSFKQSSGLSDQLRQIPGMSEP